MGNVLQSFGTCLKHPDSQEQEVCMDNNPQNTVNGRQTASLHGFSTSFSVTFIEKRAAITCLGQKIDLCCMGNYAASQIFNL